VIRAFVKMCSALLGTRELAKKLRQLEKQLTKRLDAHEVAIFDVLQELMNILNPLRNQLRPSPRSASSTNSRVLCRWTLDVERSLTFAMRWLDLSGSLRLFHSSFRALS